jgi:hypothetical protein
MKNVFFVFLMQYLIILIFFAKILCVWRGPEECTFIFNFLSFFVYLNCTHLLLIFAYNKIYNISYCNHTIFFTNKIHLIFKKNTNSWQLHAKNRTNIWHKSTKNSNLILETFEISNQAASVLVRAVVLNLLCSVDP